MSRVETEELRESSKDFVITSGRKRYDQSSLAGVSLRCSAFLLDYILALFIPTAMLIIAVYCKHRLLIPMFADTLVIIGYVALAVVIFFNWVYSYVRYGQSFGKRFIGLRVIRKDGGPMDYQTAVLRHLVGYPLSLLCLGLGFLWIVWDADQRGWHDKLAKTVVVKD